MRGKSVPCAAAGRLVCPCRGGGGMGKPIEISRAEYYAIKKALKKKAQKLINAHRKSIHYPFVAESSLFFSESPKPCHYEFWNLPHSFKYRYCNPLDELFHFISFPCSCSKQAIMNNNEEAICLMKSFDGKFYLNTHRIGKCTWKEPLND